MSTGDRTIRPTRSPQARVAADRVGFDGNPESQAALTLARSIASAADCLLEIRGVVDDSVAGGLRTEQIALAGDAITQRQLVSTFERDLAATSGSGVPARLEVETGSPSRVLQELSGRVDLLVVGSSRRGRPARLQLGKTANVLLEAAWCPVLVLPRPNP